MDGWRCNTGRRASKKSLGGDCRWVVSTGMLMLRRKPCLFVGWTGQEVDAASGHTLTHVKQEGRRTVGDKHLNEGGGLVQGHVGRGDVQAQPGRLLPLQAAGALPLWFSHLLCPPPGLPAARRQETTGSFAFCDSPSSCGAELHHKMALMFFFPLA